MRKAQRFAIELDVVETGDQRGAQILVEDGQTRQALILVEQQQNAGTRRFDPGVAAATSRPATTTANRTPATTASPLAVLLMGAWFRLK